MFVEKLSQDKIDEYILDYIDGLNNEENPKINKLYKKGNKKEQSFRQNRNI